MRQHGTPPCYPTMLANTLKAMDREDIKVLDIVEMWGNG